MQLLSYSISATNKNLTWDESESSVGGEENLARVHTDVKARKEERGFESLGEEVVRFTAVS